MNHHEERKEVFVIAPNGEKKPLDLQPAFDVLKNLNLDHHISEEERRALQVQ